MSLEAELIRRVRTELAADFPGEIRVSRAPGRLDVMGGIADYTGSVVCAWPLDKVVAVALSPREDRQLQVFSFNLFDSQKPFTLRVPLDALQDCSVEQLHGEFAEPGRRWAAYVAGCCAILREQGYLDLAAARGLNIAIDSSVPIGAGVSSSGALEVAAMINIIDHFGLRHRVQDTLGGLSVCY